MAGATAPGELTLASSDVRLAVPADDADLRALVRRSVIDGAVKVAFTREPSFFAADGLAGASDTTVVAKRDGRLVGLGRASVYPLMRNGTASRVGYLAALRVDAGTARAPRLIRAGYRLLFAESGSSATSFFTSIARDNERGRRVLENGGRLGIPAYRRLADLVTMVAPVRRHRVPRVRGDDRGMTTEELTDFLARQSGEYQLGLGWESAMWSALRPHGVRPEDFIVVRRGDRVAGAAAVWDQSCFKQTLIHGYHRPLDVARPALNVLRALAGQPSLPPPGGIIRQGALLGAYVTSPDDWRQIWPVLLERAHQMGLSWLTICRDQRDPELETLRRVTRGREYLTTLYSVGPESGPWDGRLFRPEVGLL